ncbi:hypothetical protein ALC53_09820, partial [Atta colombica]
FVHSAGRNFDSLKAPLLARRQVDRGFFPGIPITRVEQVIVCPYLTSKREGYID